MTSRLTIFDFLKFIVFPPIGTISMDLQRIYKLFSSFFITAVQIIPYHHSKCHVREELKALLEDQVSSDSSHHPRWLVPIPPMGNQA